MRYLEGQLIWSATDLVSFGTCAHLTQLELAAARGEFSRPIRTDPFGDLLARQGIEHESAVLAAYPPADVVLVTPDTRTLAGLERAAAETEAAMRAGARVIYRATFFHDGWVGHADFVERVDDRPSDLASWSYRAVDSKLALKVKPRMLLQLAEYSEHLTRIQGVAPEHVVVITGDSVRHTGRLADIAKDHRDRKAALRAAVAPGAPEPYPEPVDYCKRCRWAERCSARRRADDHLSLVAGIRSKQIHVLRDAGIRTRRELAAGPTERPDKRLQEAAYQRLRHQAALQVRADDVGGPLYEFVECIDALPSPSPGDLFLDLEGDAFALAGGLEYLFGIADLHSAYHGFWAHTRHEERLAFEAVVDFIGGRHRVDPGLHVYHYAAYETMALQRLAARHDTRIDDLGALLGTGVFVDLFAIVKQSLLLSTESYGLKAVEQLYQPARRGAVLDAGASIVAYEEHLRDPDPAILDGLARYNRADCESLVLLRAWLEERRPEAGRAVRSWAHRATMSR